MMEDHDHSEVISNQEGQERICRKKKTFKDVAGKMAPVLRGS